MATPPDMLAARDAVDHAIKGRYANRHYLATPVAAALVHDILDVARFAPSGANTQPWRTYVLAGPAKKAVSAAIAHANATEADAHQAEYKYYCADLPDPYRDRRADFGKTFYGSLGIDQTDQAARARQTAKNYDFFGAPIGLIFTIDRRLEVGSWLDLGMFIQNVMIAARTRGLETCAQETLAKYHRVLRAHLPISPDEKVVCGMSLGHPDPQAAARRGVMTKIPVAAFATFIGFDEAP